MSLPLKPIEHTHIVYNNCFDNLIQIQCDG